MSVSYLLFFSLTIRELLQSKDSISLFYEKNKNSDAKIIKINHKEEFDMIF